jgi:hypothetical protein
VVADPSVRAFCQKITRRTSASAIPWPKDLVFSLAGNYATSVLVCYSKKAGLNPEWRSYGYRSDVRLGSTRAARPLPVHRRRFPQSYTGAMFLPSRMFQFDCRPLFRSFVAFVALAVTAASAYAWGNEGHRMVNRLAASLLPSDVPAFLRSDAAVAEIEYLGPEPDRWRALAEPELSAAQAPEHFIDLEPADALGPFPRNRLDFESKVFASGQRPEKIGLQPWETMEVWERLKAALREYRHLIAAGQNTQAVEQAVIFYAGWLGHYVGDGSQPLHTTIQYNGWVGPNPNGYTTEHSIHWQFEGPFVGANIQPAQIQAKMSPVHAIDGDLFTAYIAYLRDTATHVEKVYQLEKAEGFVGAGSPESRDFAAARLAAGASMLRDMIYTAWLESDKPVPDPHASSNSAGVMKSN